MIYKNLNINLLKLPKVRVATGLYSHWDSVVKINNDILNWVKEVYKEKPKDIILNSLEEVAYTVNEAIQKGGKEFLISKDVYNRLNQFFMKREFRIGGNGFNMGNTLLLAGLTPIVSFPTRPKKLMESSPELNVVVLDFLKKPKQAIRSTDVDIDQPEHLGGLSDVFAFLALRFNRSDVRARQGQS